MRTAFSLLLVVEGLSSALRFAGRLPLLSFYPPLTVLFIVLRLLVALQQFTAGAMVLSARPAGAAFARTALFASAALTTFELGFGFAPGNLFPAYRWPAVGLYWVYAVAGALVFRAPRRL